MITDVLFTELRINKIKSRHNASLWFFVFYAFGHNIFLTTDHFWKSKKYRYQAIKQKEKSKLKRQKTRL